MVQTNYLPIVPIAQQKAMYFHHDSQKLAEKMMTKYDLGPQLLNNLIYCNIIPNSDEK